MRWTAASCTVMGSRPDILREVNPEQTDIPILPDR